ncbi:MAG TPA: 50S ribosomal protein L17 [Thermodesulfatator atlanticus]|uniref:Large ribosomal subunit protein bL17 n=1 Tax=Thermodesulfatator atlanticus TaxID=501497 RepID=A0A7V5NYB9_9BACT|nr:50S ribosomal protein L17 [Thermodesulfatator atlanticus]
MRHRKRSRRLVGKWEHRQALLRNLLVALFVHEKIKTTEAKAKELRRWADKMITLAKKGDLAARRQALSILPNKAVVRKLFSELKERYAYRQSGFTRIVRIGPRRGDAAMMVFIELVTDKLEHKPSPAKKKAEEEAKAEAPKAEAPKAEAPPEAGQEEAKGTEEEAKVAEAKPEAEQEGQPEARGEEQVEAASSEAATVEGEEGQGPQEETQAPREETPAEEPKEKKESEEK